MTDRRKLDEIIAEIDDANAMLGEVASATDDGSTTPADAERTPEGETDELAQVEEEDDETLFQTW